MKAPNLGGLLEQKSCRKHTVARAACWDSGTAPMALTSHPFWHKPWTNMKKNAAYWAILEHKSPGDGGF